MDEIISAPSTAPGRTTASQTTAGQETSAPRPRPRPRENGTHGRRARHWLVVTVVATSLALVTAWALILTVEQPVKVGDGVERTDVESVAGRLPGLDDAEGVTWFSGWYSGKHPGQEAVRTWMDAVVQLPEGQGAELAEAYDARAQGEAPEVVPELSDDVPSGTLRGSPALDAAFSTSYWHTRAYVSVSTDEVVLVVDGWSERRSVPQQGSPARAPVLHAHGLP